MSNPEDFDNPQYPLEEDTDPTLPEMGVSTDNAGLSEDELDELDSLLSEVIASESFTGELPPPIAYTIYYSDQHGGRGSESGEKPSFEEAVREIVMVSDDFKELGLICYKVEIECVAFNYEEFMEAYRGI